MKRYLRRVYVWELPVRFYHWLNALLIVILVATGLYISSPLAIQSSEEASARFAMGYIRTIHFMTAYLFVFNFLFRIYWGFVGNKYANWKNFIGLSKKFWKQFWQVIKLDVLLLKGKEYMAVGHNAVAGFTYFIFFLASVVMVFTGFGLYASMSSWWFPKLFAWVPSIFGGDILTRQIHHATTWFFIIFTIIHVYLVLFHDYVEGRGEISSMGGGWKFIEEEVFDEHSSQRFKGSLSDFLEEDKVIQVIEQEEQRKMADI
ncbi:MAG TPA: Ni/Fe-hydrogenase, b-type cytochrome subunit [Phnomibacter sp.]|nr:Ni/Fe-hydrogenase, b-type cytochrome subunit [Phnomibacter sp.]